MQRNLSACEMDNEELDNFNSDEEPAQSFMSKFKAKKKHAKRKVYHQEADTNVYRINLSCLKNDATMATGDPEICPKCGAVFNVHSKIVDEDGKQFWDCEFCCSRNGVCLDEEEIP